MRRFGRQKPERRAYHEQVSVSRIVAGMDLGIRASSVLSLRLGGVYAQKGGTATVEGCESGANSPTDPSGPGPAG